MRIDGSSHASLGADSQTRATLFSLRVEGLTKSNMGQRRHDKMEFTFNVNHPVQLSYYLSGAILVILVLSKYFVASCRPRKFPPGPRTLPFIGNISQVPRVKAFLKYTFVILFNQ
jgi:hypothetical protein